VSGLSPGASAGGEVPREIKEMLHIAYNPPQHLVQRRPRFCVVGSPRGSCDDVAD
jgi:hypothetical protein